MNNHLIVACYECDRLATGTQRPFAGGSVTPPPEWALIEGSGAFICDSCMDEVESRIRDGKPALQTEQR